MTNTNGTSIKNVSLQILELKGYELSDFQKEIKFLKPNESISLQTVYTIKSDSGKVVERDDKNSPKVSQPMDSAQPNASTELLALNSLDNTEGIAKRVDSINTGDQTNIVLGFVLFALTLICITVGLLRKKKTGNFFVLLLMVLLMSTFLSGISMKAEAADSEKAIKIKTKIQLGKQQREIEATVKYTLGNTEMPGDDRITREIALRLHIQRRQLKL